MSRLTVVATFTPVSLGTRLGILGILGVSAAHSIRLLVVLRQCVNRLGEVLRTSRRLGTVFPHLSDR